ncbi:hypothetical protein AOCH_004533 [Aspergillus ochraceoroseus]|uniref:N-acetyltransferase domain-containing protein n=1 Tax=Aspergillus ochraceoroseus TaxID=138278 RepID=A0A0F8V5I1_9EURO|nr:hypothetical protein AOCH_004533 [Aspergillus ochraceoroseus]
MAIIRPATPADLPQVRAISTYYILNTALIFTQTSPPPAVFQAKYDDLKSRGLPYVVAVDEELTNAEDGADLVLGYAYLSPFRSHMLSYAATVELSLFVHPDHQSRSLGSRLLAAVLEAAPAVRHRAYEVTGSDEEPRKVFAGEKGESEGGLPLRNILAVMADHADQGKQRVFVAATALPGVHPDLPA